MLTELERRYEEAAAALAAAEGREALAAWHRDTLGKKGGIYQLTRNMAALSPEERPAFGRRLNEIKTQLEAGYDQRLAEAEAAALAAQMAAGALDVTLPDAAWPTAASTSPRAPCATSTASSATWASRSTAAPMSRRTR